MPDRALGGRVDGPGDPKIIENQKIFMHFDCSGNGLGARAAQESLRIYKCYACSWFGREGGGPWRHHNHRKSVVS